MSKQIRVVAAVIRRGDTLLVCQRPAHQRHGGLWEFPGGKCELGESDAEAIRRELREELQVETVNVEESQYKIADPDSPFLIAFVHADIIGEPVAREHQALLWATANQLLGVSLAPSDRRYLENSISQLAAGS